MTQSRIPALACAAFAFLFTACLDAEPEDSNGADSRCSEAECGPIEDRGAFLPMAKGNMWVLARTMPDTGTAASDSVGLVVTGWQHSNQDSSEVWWSLGALWARQGNEWPSRLSHSVRGDSIYSRTIGSGGSFFETSTDLEFVFPTGSDTVRYGAFFGGDVAIQISAVRLQDPVTVPAGTFTGCVVYLYSGDVVERIVLCPGVGWVSVEGRNDVVHQLVAYELKE